MSKPPESHYNPQTLHKIFAIAAVILLFAVGGLVMNDYDRKWKDYQKQFRTMEVEKTRIEYDSAQMDLDNNPDYQQLLTDLEKEQNSYQGRCDTLTDIKEQIKELETQHLLITQKYKSAKTELDVAKFQYEEAQGHQAYDPEITEKKYLELKNNVREYEKDLENLKAEIEKEAKVIDDCGKSLAELNRRKRKLTAEVNLIERKLKTIDPVERGFVNQIADMIRDFPIIDLSTPNQKINQIVLKDITNNLIFTHVPKVERCTTCHLGITDPAYEDLQQPYGTHPNLDLFLSNDSAHPIEEFGCTVCHGGRGRGTSFTTAVHTPVDEEQKKEWEEKYDWHKFHHWEEPMLAKPYFEAGCYKCHKQEADIKGAPKLDLGLQLIERAGCYNCHEIERYHDWKKSGPTLLHLAEKFDKTWAYKWIENPQSFRHNTWMPNYFNQTNNNDPASVKRSEQEIHSIVHYLFENSIDYKEHDYDLMGDAVKGEELVASLGCFACHKIDHDFSDTPTTADTLNREHGPNLIGLGTKTSKEWLFNWLKDPTRYHPETRMPNLRLTDKEAADITEYLYQGENNKFEEHVIPSIDSKELNKIVYGFLKSMNTDKQANKRISEMSQDEKLYFAGEKLIGQYGCYSCHNIKGFEDAKPIGIELTLEGDKPVNKLDFGFIHIPHTKEAWFSQKLKDPRIFDLHKAKDPDEKLMMPNFYLKDQEIEAIVTALLGFVDDSTVQKKKPEMGEGAEFVLQGAHIIRELNCNSCHVIQGKGGTIQDSIKESLIKYGGMDESNAEKIYENMSPPNLRGIGKKLNPQWLFSFLHNPETVRPWLKVRMPTYNFNSSHLNLLVKYFNYLDDDEFPFFNEVDSSLTQKEFVAAEKMFSNDYFDCQKCHVVGNTMPNGTKDTWAPNLSLAKTRLKPGWLIEWLKNPSKLMPGTKMPTFWDPSDYENSGPPDIFDGDEDKQIRVLRDYLMNLSDQENTSIPASKDSATPANQN